MRDLTTSCLINNHNYLPFVVEAIESALGQTQPFNEIIVVDDGSTDGSAQLLASTYSGHNRVQLVTKRNEGQLSCFNEGFARAQGQIVFFLDADDVLESDYVAQTLEVYRALPEVDFVFCGQQLFGDLDRVYLQYEQDRDLGYSAVLTALKQHWIGAPTSCLSMRRSVLEEILPLPFVDRWRIRADDCLVFGSSLVGARKYFLAQPLVRYRVHARNRFFGRDQDKFTSYRRRLAINTLFEHFRRKLCYDPERFGELVHREFRTISRPTFRDLRHYSKLVLKSKAPRVRRLLRLAGMTRDYLRTRFQSPAPVCAPALANRSAAETLVDAGAWSRHSAQRDQRTKKAA